MEVCCIKGCDSPILALGMCNKHWRRTKLYGSPAAVKSHTGLMRGLSASERFFKQLKKTESCWEWASSKDKDGYGIFRGGVAGVNFTRAHRYSYAMHKGSFDQKMLVMHSCDNPSCVNPAHLSLGSNTDNMADKIAKGRARVPFGAFSPHSKITEDEARKILADIRPYTQIAADYGLAASSISSIKNGESWGHLDDIAIRGRHRGNKPGAPTIAKLSEDDVRSIRASTETGSTLSKKYSVSQATICDIRKGRSWLHIK